MKAKNIFWMALVAVALSVGATSCGDDDDDPVVDPSGGNENVGGNTSSADLDYSAANANSWHNYMKQVAYLLKADATTLYEAWNTSYEGGEAYAQSFKNHTRPPYESARNCVEEILDGCVTIADEVGNAKIGEPYNLYNSGDITSALYAVESWYSWHSRDDYTNNIWSIRNAYFGSLDGSVNANSLSAVVKAADADLDAEVVAVINRTAAAIQAIPQPFRNHINCDEARAAMAACKELVDVMDIKLRTIVTGNAISDEALDAVVDNYVDAVVLPTYKDLMEKNGNLYNKVVALATTPTNEAFEAACDAWLAAREPWEKSEAFLFGPVDALGLDPNMDSWPLDQDAIVQILTSGNFDDLDWSDEDGDEAIEAAQSVRGFHTLEYLLFKDGNPRRAN